MYSCEAMASVVVDGNLMLAMAELVQHCLRRVINGDAWVSSTTSPNLSSAISHIFDWVGPYQIAYHAKLDEGLLEAVREDPRVSFVECSGMGRLHEPVEQ